MSNIAPVQQNQVATIDDLLIQNTYEIAKLLPSHIEPEKFIKLCTSALMLNPGLRECTQESLYNAFLSCAKDGLVPDNREAAIVSYKVKGTPTAQYQVMVDGLLKKVRQSGVIASIAARAVFENDQFDYYFDEDGEHIKYRPCLNGDHGEFKLAFAYAKFKTNNEFIVEVMPKSEIDRVRAASKTGQWDSSPWTNWYDRMAVKSVLHRLGRRLPNSTEILEIIERDIDIEKFDNKAQPKAVENKPTMYPEEDFEKNLPKWLSAIESNKKTADEIIDIVSTKGELNGEQKARIKGES